MLKLRSLRSYNPGNPNFFVCTRYDDEEGIYRHRDFSGNIVYIGKEYGAYPTKEEVKARFREAKEAGIQEIKFLEILTLREFKQFWTNLGVAKEVVDMWDITYMEAWCLSMFKEKHGDIPKYSVKHDEKRHDEKDHPKHISSADNIRVNLENFERLSASAAAEVVLDRVASRKLWEAFQVAKPEAPDSDDDFVANMKLSLFSGSDVTEPVAKRLRCRKRKHRKLMERLADGTQPFP